MTVALLIITHQQVGHTLLRQAEALLGPYPGEAAVVSVPPDADPAEVLRGARDHLDTVDSGEGVLVMTDVFGATPSNIAHQLGSKHRHVVVHGLNLAMLMRAHNYADQPLDALARRVVEGGHRSIFAGDPQ